MAGASDGDGARRRGLILAAGRGSRLGPRTDRGPKCLLTLGGRTLLDWQIAALRAAGVAEIAVVVGYRGAMIDRPDLRRYRNERWAASNMVRSLLCARDWWCDAACVIAYGDIAFHPDHVVRLARAPGEIAITCDLAWRSLWEERFERPEEDAESLRVENGVVVEIGAPVHDREGLDAVSGQYMGLVQLRPSGSRAILDSVARRTDADVDRLQMTELLGALARDGVPIEAVPVDGRWCEVDRGTDLELYETRLGAEEPWRHDWRF
jgi:L-glutamine-phosphate cytidylyltransferase